MGTTASIIPSRKGPGGVDGAFERRVLFPRARQTRVRKPREGAGGGTASARELKDTSGTRWHCPLRPLQLDWQELGGTEEGTFEECGPGPSAAHSSHFPQLEGFSCPQGMPAHRWVLGTP